MHQSSIRSAPEGHASWRLSTGAIPVWVYDRVTGAVEASNPAATGIYGGSLGGRDLHEVLRDVQREARALLRTAHDTVRWVGPLVHVRKDGSTFLAEVGLLSTDVLHTLVLVSPDGEPRGET